MPKTTIAERLYALRFEKGWSLHEAAKTIKAGKLTWKKWEQNQPVVLGRTSKQAVALFESLKNTSK
jgi:transcriptional regulator with XRE-family HTH domain